jgi:hypothetical protein
MIKPTAHDKSRGRGSPRPRSQHAAHGENGWRQNGKITQILMLLIQWLIRWLRFNKSQAPDFQQFRKSINFLLKNNAATTTSPQGPGDPIGHHPWIEPQVHWTTGTYWLIPCVYAGVPSRSRCVSSRPDDRPRRVKARPGAEDASTAAQRMDRYVDQLTLRRSRCDRACRSLILMDNPQYGPELLTALYRWIYWIQLTRTQPTDLWKGLKSCVNELWSSSLSMYRGTITLRCTSMCKTTELLVCPVCNFIVSCLQQDYNFMVKY